MPESWSQYKYLFIFYPTTQSDRNGWPHFFNVRSYGNLESHCSITELWRWKHGIFCSIGDKSSRGRHGDILNKVNTLCFMLLRHSSLFKNIQSGNKSLSLSLSFAVVIFCRWPVSSERHGHMTSHKKPQKYWKYLLSKCSILRKMTIYYRWLKINKRESIFVEGKLSSPCTKSKYANSQLLFWPVDLTWPWGLNIIE